MSKDNIMKLTDGLFHSVFDELAKEYPDIENEHWIIDIGSAKLAAQPEMFDVIVTPNLYGDIISDIAAEISGSVGLGGSSNIGEECAMFEAIHGSAPQIAGQGIANPSGLILASCQMLQHLNEVETAELIENAWIKTIEDGVATADFYDASVSTSKLKTQEFAKEIINRLGEKPKTLSPRVFSKKTRKAFVPNSHPRQDRKLDGVDIFLYDDERVPDLVGDRLNGAAEGHALNLKMITNRGVKVYPDGNPHTFCTDHWRCRFLPDEGGQIQHEQIWSLLNDLSKNGLEVIKTELLYSFDGERGYSLGQGQ